MAVVHEITTEAQTSNINQLSFSHDPGNGTNKVLIVAIGIYDLTAGNRPVLTVTWNGISLTKIRSDENTTNGFRTEIWYLINPSDSNAQVVITTTSDVSRLKAGASTYTGASQDANPIDNSNGSNASSGDPSTLLAVSSSGCMLIDCVSVDTSGVGAAGSGQNIRWNQVGTSQEAAGSDELAGSAGDYTQTWDIDGSSGFAHTVIALKEVVITEKNVSDAGSGSESPSLETIYNKNLSDSGASSEALDKPYTAITMGETGAGTESVGNLASIPINDELLPEESNF